MTKQTNLIEKFAPFAQELHKKHGILASVTIAQLIQEAGWDLKTPVDVNTGKESYNLFGVKGSGPAGSVYATTTEVYANRSSVPKNARNIIQRPDGKWRFTIEDYFAAYNSYTESLEGHAKFLLKNQRYKPVLKATNGIEAAKQLQVCGYATDPGYAKSLVSLINTHKLMAYDTPNEEEETLKLTDSQWEMLAKQLHDLFTKKLIADYSWVEKASNKTISASELLFLNTVILNRNTSK